MDINQELEVYEKALLEAVTKAQQVADHCSSSRVKPNQLVAAFLSCDGTSNVEPSMAENLGLTRRSAASLVSHQPSCQCTDCQSTLMEPMTLLEDTHTNRLASALPFRSG